MWAETPYQTVLAAYEWLPSGRFAEQYMISRLAYAFEAFSGAKPGEFLEWLPSFLTPKQGGKPKATAFFTPAVAADVDLAFDLGYLSQAALAALGPKRLRESGAFAKNRNTITTNH